MIDSLSVIQRALNSKRNQAVWILWGQELWAKKQALKLLKKYLVPDGMEAFSFDHFYAPETPVSTVIDSALTLAMMTEQKLVYVENCQKWDNKQRKQLLEYFKDPCQQACLLLDFDLEKTGKMGKFFQFKHSDVSFLEFPKPSSWELEAYIGKLAVACGVKLDKPSRAILAEYTGDDIELMHREIEKLQLFKHGEDGIQAEDIEALTGMTRHVSRWELQKKLSNRNVAEGLVKAQDILKSGETAIGLLSVLARYIGQLLTVKALAAEGVKDKFALAGKLHMPPNIAAPLLMEHRKFSGVELRAALKQVSESDDMLKGARLDGGSILAHLITSLLRTDMWSP